MIRLSSPYNAEYVHAGGLLSAGSYGGFTVFIRTRMDGYCLSVDVQIHYLIWAAFPLWKNSVELYVECVNLYLQAVNRNLKKLVVSVDSVSNLLSHQSDLFPDRKLSSVCALQNNPDTMLQHQLSHDWVCTHLWRKYGSFTTLQQIFEQIIKGRDLIFSCAFGGIHVNWNIVQIHESELFKVAHFCDEFVESCSLTCVNTAVKSLFCW